MEGLSSSFPCVFTDKGLFYQLVRGANIERKKLTWNGQREHNKNRVRVKKNIVVFFWSKWGKLKFRHGKKKINKMRNF